MSARVLTVTFVSACCAYVRGYDHLRQTGARELIVEIRGRAPVWVVSMRAWAVQEHTARDLIAVAEARGWDVEIVDERHLLALADMEYAEERGLLW